MKHDFDLEESTRITITETDDYVQVTTDGRVEARFEAQECDLTTGDPKDQAKYLRALSDALLRACDLLQGNG